MTKKKKISCAPLYTVTQFFSFMFQQSRCWSSFFTLNSTRTLFLPLDCVLTCQDVPPVSASSPFSHNPLLTHSLTECLPLPLLKTAPLSDYDVQWRNNSEGIQEVSSCVCFYRTSGMFPLILLKAWTVIRLMTQQKIFSAVCENSSSSHHSDPF